jgi:hypothetical protein
MENPIEQQLNKVLENNSVPVQPKKRRIAPLIRTMFAVPLIINIVLILLSLGKDADTQAGFVFALPVCIIIFIAGLIISYFLNKRAKA